MEAFMEFVFAASPFVVMGAFIAVLVVRHAVKTNKKKTEKEQIKNYGTEGMCLGMSFGALIGAICGNYIGICMMLGMVMGLAIGMCISKKEGDTK